MEEDGSAIDYAWARAKPLKYGDATLLLFANRNLYTWFARLCTPSVCIGKVVPRRGQSSPLKHRSTRASVLGQAVLRCFRGNFWMTINYLSSFFQWAFSWNALPIGFSETSPCRMRWLLQGILPYGWAVKVFCVLLKQLTRDYVQITFLSSCLCNLHRAFYPTGYTVCKQHDSYRF